MGQLALHLPSRRAKYRAPQITDQLPDIALGEHKIATTWVTIMEPLRISSANIVYLSPQTYQLAQATVAICVTSFTTF